MSRSLLAQLAPQVTDAQHSKHLKRASNSTLASNRFDLIKHDFTDDLESLFYIFVWICVTFCGPLGKERQHTLQEGRLPYDWSSDSPHQCYANKFMYMTLKSKITSQFDPYFKDLSRLATEWAALLEHNHLPQSPSPSGDVTRYEPATFEGVIELLEKHLADLADESSPEHVLRKRVVDTQIEDVHNRDQVVRNMRSTGVVATKKRGLDDVWTVEGASSKRNRRRVH